MTLLFTLDTDGITFAVFWRTIGMQNKKYKTAREKGSYKDPDILNSPS